MGSIKTEDDFSKQREKWAKGDAQPVITDRDRAGRIALPGQDIAVLLAAKRRRTRWASSRSSPSPERERPRIPLRR